jgi:hypothetical protein
VTDDWPQGTCPNESSSSGSLLSRPLSVHLTDNMANRRVFVEDAVNSVRQTRVVTVRTP